MLLDDCLSCLFTNSSDLLHIRKHLQQDPDSLRAILASASFKDNFVALRGSQLKRAPKGFDVEDPAIDLLRYKQYFVRHSFTNEEVMQPDFLNKVVIQFENMRPFFDYMSDILTSDLNGEFIV